MVARFTTAFYFLWRPKAVAPHLLSGAERDEKTDVSLMRALKEAIASSCLV